MTYIFFYGDINYEQYIYLKEFDNLNDTHVESVKFNLGVSAFNK